MSMKLVIPERELKDFKVGRKEREDLKDFSMAAREAV